MADVAERKKEQGGAGQAHTMSHCRGGFAGYGAPGLNASPGRYGNYGRYCRPWAHGLGGTNPAAASPDDPDMGPAPPGPTIGQQILHGTRAGLASVALTTPLTIGLTTLLFFTGLLGDRDPGQYGYKDTTDIYSGPVTFGAHRAQAHSPNCYYHHQRRW